ncbi:hypothetical protein GIB67_019783 [Kingdonia uniflora]|uniref:Uncharacterized protein n=1 Tax=Kingdonia uniflora TaxID=39325 RepID=A0A7J7MK65_9MAGN|nr:hypothetical protein GIB67_019783 [Kingdonia uniflora]
MSPQRRLLPLLLTLSLTALLFLYSYHHNSSLQLILTPTSTSKSTSTHFTPFSPLSPQFTLTIKLLSFDRLESLSRCLRSLANADYGTDRVNLHVFIDHFKEINVSGSGVGVVDQKLRESQKILSFVDGFSWGFGEKLVHYRTGNVGLQAQWLEAWWPSSDDEFAFVVEDDLELSRLYYKFLRELILNYYYNSSNYSPLIYGASLQRPRFVPGKHGNKLQLDKETRLFLYQLVGTWGQLLFPKPWKEFRLWYDMHKAKGIKPILQGMVTTGWYKKLGERIWTPWFIKFIHSRGYFNIYTNFQRERALSVSHRDAGVNYGKTAGPDSNLIDASSLDFNLLEMGGLANLKWYDFCFREVIPERIVRNLHQLGSVLYSVQKHKMFILVSMFNSSPAVIKNMLCHFERLDVQNFILVGPKSDFLLDLAIRGHAVIAADEFLVSIKDYKLKGFGGFETDILVKSHVIKKGLDLGYSSWVIDGNMLPINADVFSDVSESDPSYDIYAGKDSELVFVRSSSATVKIWVDKFIYKIADTMASLTDRQRHLGYVLSKFLLKESVRIKKVDELSFGVKVGENGFSETALEVGKKAVFWSSETSFSFIQKKLEDLGVWAIDAEFLCTAVICHQS